MPYTIGACGYIGTGSSAVSDFLKEFADNQALDKLEFKLAYHTDGLLDLKYHLTDGNMKYEAGLSAIQRFQKSCRGYQCKNYRRLTNNRFVPLADEFLESLIQAKWVGLGADPAIDPFRLKVSRIMRDMGLFKYYYELEIKKGRELQIYPLQQIYFSMYPEDIDEKIKRFVCSVLEAMGWDKKRNVVLDQPFAGNNPEAVFPFFENPKAIVIDRDPRDYYLAYPSFYYSKGWRQVPAHSVEDFVVFYRKIRETSLAVESDRVLRINFEDMIYRYDSTTSRIREFCDLKEHTNPRRYFKPEMSAKNTQLFRKFPEYADQVAYIEKMLPEYLYDYDAPGCDKYDINGEMFHENPLNK